MREKLFNKDFILVVIGQIISLFGNNILRYALPLYLLNETGSAALYGMVMALSFVPILIISPIGGIIADRVNKRNIMVCLDFMTAFIVSIYTLTYQEINIASLIIIVLVLLFGIQGAYQPTVQASIPVLVPEENLMTGNAIINMVNSLAQILGPVLGGVVFGFWGLEPILIVSIICFTVSAIMEIFIYISYEKQDAESGIVKTIKSDMRESLKFVCHERKEICRVSVLLTIANMIFSALIVVGLPIIVNIHLGFSKSAGNRLYGYAEGVLAAGGLLGALLSGVLCKKMKISHGAMIIFGLTFTLLPMGIVLSASNNGMFSYIVILASCFIMMILSTLLSIELITYVQKITPHTLIGKVMALLTGLVMCGHPIGQFVYGLLFEKFKNQLSYIFYVAFILCIGLSIVSNKVFSKLSDEVNS